MLRKDVKIGFVVGGILIATLIAYVITAGRGKAKKVELAEGPDAVQQVQPAGSEDPAPSPQAQPEATPPADTGKPAVPTPDPVAEKASKPADPFQPTGNTKDVWATALNSGTVLMSMTPSTPAGSEPASANTAAATPEAKDATSPSLLPPSTQPSEKAEHSIRRDAVGSTGGRSHVVQKGETLTMISIAAYGDQKYWKQIAAANPSLNPNKLKPGTQIVLPELGARKEQIAGPLNGGVSAPTSSKTQYQVQAGDSLRRIALKLYGKENMWQKIYELNKSEIGGDPAKLKLHMTLKLPQAPTTA